MDRLKAYVAMKMRSLESNVQLMYVRHSNASTDEFEDYDEELFFKLQRDVSTRYINTMRIGMKETNMQCAFNSYHVVRKLLGPKLDILHPGDPIVVQLNLGKFGSGPQLTSNNVSFDVYYHGMEIQNNRSVLEEIVHNVNRNRRRYISYWNECSHMRLQVTPFVRTI
ncbi:hypothetical protein AHF37_10409 [Paragonimus kellicotti]|nr:hypothetical protein AHF37_10409 [Paragonimus kellicotti]